MNVVSNLVGISPKSSEATEIAYQNSILDHGPDPKIADGEAADLDADTDDWSESYSDDAHSEEYFGEDMPNRRWTGLIIPAVLALLFLGWSAFFGWTHQAELLAVTPNIAAQLIGQWVPPAALICILWLLMMRSSHSETNRFADIALKLRNESEALELRMRTVNEEISLAREFLAQNALALESIGRQSSARLVEAAETLKSALSESENQAKALEQVSSAATTNLEQLRKHLPVVTSVAKDVTNQIGNAGNSAQLQVKSLIGALQRVAIAGGEARENIDGMEAKAIAVSGHLEMMIGQNTASLGVSLDNAGQQSQQLAALLAASTAALTTQLDNAASNMVSQVGEASDMMAAKIGDDAASVSELLSQSATNFVSKIAISRADIDQVVDRNLSKLTQQTEMLRESLRDMESQSAAEDTRAEQMIARITEHLADRSKQLAQIDDEATQRSIKLAFALEALVETSGQLTESLLANQRGAEGLTERSDNVMHAISSAKKELTEDLPAAINQADQNVSESLNRLKLAARNADLLGQHSGAILANLSDIDDRIAQQQNNYDQLRISGGIQLGDSKLQADALSESLRQIQAMLAKLTDVRESDLSQSVARLKDNIQIAARESRETMEQELAAISARLGDVSQSSLKSAVEDQVAAISDILGNTIRNNLALSGEATEKLTRQLAQIDSMTSNLEGRLSEARGGFGGIDEDSFARQMALLTESLNSTAIDVAKILSNEVTDTSWAAYLKGDRGVFTRRAVRLLDAGEAKAIVTHYDEDPEFREHVNRYIHDFEAMMRALLSTRDGNAIGVTLLSSDVGKLYVALAQAIERLRNN